jgi:cell wall assembly regulator SMI1
MRNDWFGKIMDGDSPWVAIDAWLAEHAPHILAQLRAPASRASLERLAAVAGPLPAGLVTAYTAHDGADGEWPAIFGAVRVPRAVLSARYTWWLSTEDAAAQLELVRDLGGWPSALLPFAADGAGNLLVVDLKRGAISAWDHETAETTRLADDFDAWMRDLASDMAASRVEEDGEDALTLLDAPPVRVAAPPLTPDRDARVLLAVMVEERFIELVGGADYEPLIALLHEALKSKPLAERTRRVESVLHENAVVDELFADDERIERLLKRLG